MRKLARVADLPKRTLTQAMILTGRYLIVSKAEAATLAFDPRFHDQQERSR
jgi:hypothetical protein